MSNFDAQQHAAARGLEDAKAANAVTQATGQTLVFLNGGAATATLTFSSAVHPPFNISPIALAFSVVLFATGVFFGLNFLSSQGERLQYWSTYWDSEANLCNKEAGDRAKSMANSFDDKVGHFFRYSINAFLGGLIALGLSKLLENLPVTVLTVMR